MSAGTPVLAVTDLHVTYQSNAGPVRAVNGISFAIERGECLGVIGRSGSGKTQTFLAMMGLLPTNARVRGSAMLNGIEILDAPLQRLLEVRGSRLAMIFQDPLTSLTPHMSIGAQLMEVLLRHTNASRREAYDRMVDALGRVQIPDPARRARQYPHEMSGGMRQRVMIAMALLCKPDLLIADEPTTALEVTVQAEILDLLRELAAQAGTAIAFITHDLGVVAELCDRAIVMLNGGIVEEAAIEPLFRSPQHAYTRSLIEATPRLDR